MLDSLQNRCWILDIYVWFFSCFVQSVEPSACGFLASEQSFLGAFCSIAPRVRRSPQLCLAMPSWRPVSNRSCYASMCHWRVGGSIGTHRRWDGVLFAHSPVANSFGFFNIAPHSKSVEKKEIQVEGNGREKKGKDSERIGKEGKGREIEKKW